VVADFSGGTLSSDGGAMLLRQIDASLGLTRTLAGCFDDRRDQRFVDHSMVQLLAQRIYAVGLGYEDLNDHTELRRDPLLATACDKPDPLGQDRFNPQDRGIALASASTLNRLELSNNKGFPGRVRKLRFLFGEFGRQFGIERKAGRMRPGGGNKRVSPYFSTKRLPPHYK